MEIAKFFVNFTLGLYIGPQYLPNSNIYLLLNDKKLKSTMRIFCLLFNDKNINIKYLEKYFHETINKTALNINSISLSWLHGNDKPIKYFTSTVEKMIKLNHNREVKKFFIDLIDSQLVKLNR
ncbi:hypothetical protein AXG55_12210 [Silvanigrella aquatica]|uniref:Uncharacterized protein n=2 Tax=Silvanigrella aquatica TaxID=1915309 RepID=A0A1L4D356_9BACT|nr:hypothetical protein AXG55_12210 [Silvanigrella aquatica]